jgi:hypothetical protein
METVFDTPPLLDGGHYLNSDVSQTFSARLHNDKNCYFYVSLFDVINWDTSIRFFSGLGPIRSAS